MYDIAIVGAGPAGATLARLVGGRYKVLCIDKRPAVGIPRGFCTGKCCGGLLAPDAQKMLSQLGLGLPKSVLEGPQLFVVNTSTSQSLCGQRRIWFWIDRYPRPPPEVGFAMITSRITE